MLVQFGYLRDRREGLILRLARDFAHMGDAAFHQLHLPFAVFGAFLMAGDAHFIKARCHGFDHLQRGGDFAMFLLRHLAGDENAKMSDILMQQIHNGLAERFDFAFIAIDIGNPAQCLAGWGDIVTG